MYKGDFFMKTTSLMLDMLSSLAYLPFEQNMVFKSLGEICELINANLDERLYYNRKTDIVETNNLVKPYNKNIAISYPMFKDSKNHSNKKSITLFLETIKNDHILSEYRLVFLHDDAEKFYDSNEVKNKKTSLYAMCVYSQINDEYVYIIRGTHDDSGWLDNAKTISKDLTKVEKECFRVFYEFYNELCKDTLKKIILTGHSKGGAMALTTAKMMHSLNKHKNIYVHSFYGPFINHKKLLTLGDSNINAFFDMINCIEVHIGDITGNLFLSKKVLETYKEKIVFVGDFKENRTDLAKNHEPLRRFINSNFIIKDKNYDNAEKPYKTSYDLAFSKIIFRLSYILVEEDSIVVYPLLVAFMRYSGFISDKKNIFYNDDKKLLEDYLEQFHRENINYEVYFSFDKIVDNKKQLYQIYLFLQKIIGDDELNEHFLDFFGNEKILTEIFYDETIANIVKKFVCTFLQTKKQIINNKSEKCDVFWLIEYNDFNKDTMLEMYFKSIVTILIHKNCKETIEEKSFLINMKKIKRHFGKNHFLYTMLELSIFCIYKNDNCKIEKINTLKRKRKRNISDELLKKIGNSFSENMMKIMYINR